VYAGLMAEDPDASMLASFAVALAYLGYINQARARISQAFSAARRLEHAHTLALVLGFACWSEAVAASPHEVRRFAERLMALSDEHGFPFWFAHAYCNRGWSLNMLSNGPSVVPGGTGAVRGTPRALMFLGETYSKLGQPVDCMNCLAQGELIIEKTEERYMEAELHRLRGDLVLSAREPTAAEQSYQRALTVARCRAQNCLSCVRPPTSPASSVISVEK
jgi:hypothetical protein